MNRKIVYFQETADGKQINSTLKVPKALDPKLATREFFEYVSKIKRAEQNAKSQQHKPSASSSTHPYNDDDYEDDDVKQKGQSQFTPSDCDGFDVQWVRVKVPALPQRPNKIAQCMNLYTCTILITLTSKRTDGKQMDVAVNFFEATKGFDKFHQYDIKIFPKESAGKDEEEQNAYSETLEEYDRYHIFQNGDKRKKRIALRNVIHPNRYTYVYIND